MRESGEGASSRQFRIFETRRFVSDLARFGPVTQRRIEAKLRNYVYPILRENPHSGPNIKRLKNWQPGTWRYRVGEWRFFYEVGKTGKIVFMIAADHRKEAYR